MREMFQENAINVNNIIALTTMINVLLSIKNG